MEDKGVKKNQKDQRRKAKDGYLKSRVGEKEKYE
jgi:hypothetical protein